eukprot:scaffold148919_cov35-Tisochrysis_lutea.AAC.3
MGSQPEVRRVGGSVSQPVRLYEQPSSSRQPAHAKSETATPPYKYRLAQQEETHISYQLQHVTDVIGGGNIGACVRHLNPLLLGRLIHVPTHPSFDLLGRLCTHSHVG